MGKYLQFNSNYKLKFKTCYAQPLQYYKSAISQEIHIQHDP